MAVRFPGIFILVFCVLAVSCNNAASESMRAEAELKNAGGESIGSAVFTQEKGGPVKIKVDIHSFLPGTRALHIHENPCEPPDFGKAGGHFNPYGKEHGFLNKKGPHAGDLPNILVDEDGNCTVTFISNLITLEAGKINSILRPPGTSVMIHEMPDDYFTDPAGKAGERLACGTIRKTGPDKEEALSFYRRLSPAGRRFVSLFFPARRKE